MFSICFPSIAFSLPLPQEWGADVKSPGLRMRAPPSRSLSREKPRHWPLRSSWAPAPNSWPLVSPPAEPSLPRLGPSHCTRPPHLAPQASPVSGQEFRAVCSLQLRTFPCSLAWLFLEWIEREQRPRKAGPGLPLRPSEGTRRVEKGRRPLPAGPGPEAEQGPPVHWPCQPFFHPSDGLSLPPTLFLSLLRGPVVRYLGFCQWVPRWNLSARSLPLTELSQCPCSSPAWLPLGHHLPWASPPVDILFALEEPTEVPPSPHSLSRRPRALFPFRVSLNRLGPTQALSHSVQCHRTRLVSWEGAWHLAFQ